MRTAKTPLTALVAILTLFIQCPLAFCIENVSTANDVKSESATEPSANELVVLHEQIKALYLKGQLEQALPLMRKYVRLMEKQCAGSERLALTYFNLAELLGQLNRHEESDRYRKKAKKAAPNCAQCANTGVTGMKFAKYVDRDAVFVSRIYLNTPAARAGLRSGDRIIAVDGINIGKFDDQKICTILTGTPGSSLQLEIERNYKRKLIAVTRASVRDIENPEYRDSFCHYTHPIEHRYPY